VTRQELIEMTKKHYSYAELLQTRGFGVKERKPLNDGSGDCVVWSLTKSGHTIDILTAGEDEFCTVLNEALFGVEKLEKFDLLRILHAANDWRLASSIVETGLPIFRGPLAEIGNSLKEEDQLL
jgi:hypothetical protein